MLAFSGGGRDAYRVGGFWMYVWLWVFDLVVLRYVGEFGVGRRGAMMIIYW